MTNWRPGEMAYATPPGRWSADHSHLKRTGCERRRALQHSLWRDIRQQSRLRRALERGCDSEHGYGDKDLVHRKPTAKRSPGQEAAGQSLDDLTTLHDMLPRVTICGVTGDEDKNRHRQKLNESDQAEIESAARQRIDVPAYSNDRDLRRKLSECAGTEIENERTVTEKVHGRRLRKRTGGHALIKHTLAQTHYRQFA